MSGFSIRLAVRDDGVAIARLVTELGYPTSAEQMNVRLGRLLTSTNDALFVAEITVPAVMVGWIHGIVSQCVEADYRVEIAGLVVNEEFHRRGIGAALVRCVETWGLEQGAVQASVRCRTTRPEAHLFYERLGYRQPKRRLCCENPYEFTALPARTSQIRIHIDGKEHRDQSADQQA